MLRRITAYLASAAALMLLCASPAAASFTAAIDAENSLNGISCIPATTTCVVTDDLGELLYATDVSASASATWNVWSGPWLDQAGPSPGHAVECPAATLCLLAAGEVKNGGGNLYRAASLGGEFLTTVLPANGIEAVSCPSASFCVSAQSGGGFIRYATKPNGTAWTAVSIGAGAMRDVSCLSPSFCAVVDDSGNVHVAVTEAGVKEGAGWKASNVDGATGLLGIACDSTTSCIAVDGSGDVLLLTIAADGGASVAREAVAGASALVAVDCDGLICAAGDAAGALFGSSDGGASWAMRYGSGPELTSVSCASTTLCAGVTTAGTITTFDPSAPLPPALVLLTNSLPAGTAGQPYEAQLEAEGGTPPYKWSAVGLPPGLSIDQATGKVSGTPLTAVCVQAPCVQPAATYAPTITVADLDGIPASKQLALSIARAGSAPSPPPAPPLVEPLVTELKSSHRSRRFGRGGTTLSFRLNVGASVTLQFKKRVRNRLRRNGQLFLLADAGLTKVRFKGRLPSGMLRPGRYVIEATAWGSAGQRTAPSTVGFRILP